VQLPCQHEIEGNQGYLNSHGLQNCSIIVYFQNFVIILNKCSLFLHLCKEEIFH
jgi:hypothetical protein